MSKPRRNYQTNPEAAKLLKQYEELHRRIMDEKGYFPHFNRIVLIAITLHRYQRTKKVPFA
jgi:hypothetical protein